MVGIDAVEEEARVPYEKGYGIGKRPVHEITLSGPGMPDRPVSVLLRSQGSMIRSMHVADTLVLTSDDFNGGFQPIKMDGTIPMCPAGPSGYGPQHGGLRYEDAVISYAIGPVVKLTALDRLRNLGYVMTTRLLSDGIAVTDDIVNLGGPRRLSEGKHYYLATPWSDNLRDILWLDQNLSELVVTGRLENGQDVTGPFSAFVPTLLKEGTVAISGHDGPIIVDIPGVGRVWLAAYATCEGRRGLVRQRVTWWVWHRRGSRTLCMEPVIGTSLRSDGRMYNRHIYLGSNRSMVLTSAVRLLAA
jgi:hypothetical protein